jgi:outer membrane protein assembly factor BamB
MRRPWLGAAILLVLVGAACVPIRQEAIWPSLSVLGDNQSIAVAYFDRLVLINPQDGAPVRLRNADGEVRLDEQGNARIWEFTGSGQGGMQFYASPAVLTGERLLVAEYHGRLFEVDLPTARLLSEQQSALTGQVVSAPVLEDELIYVGYTERDLVALDRATRTERWRVLTGHGVWSAPLLVDGVLYFTSLDHFLYAVDAVTGDVRWKLDLQGAAPKAPVYYEGRLYVGSFARKIFAISLDGQIVDEFETSNWVWATPTVVDGVLYVGDLSGTVYALNVTGSGFSPFWQTQVTGRAIVANAVVKNDYVVVGARDNKVYWLNRENGTIFFSRELAGEVLSDPLLIEIDPTDPQKSLVVVGTSAMQELLVAFSLQNGERAWTYGR